MLDERAGAAAVVAAEELHIDGASMTATGYPSPEGSVWTAGLGPIVANRLDPASWMYPEPLPFSFALPIELTEVDGAGNCDGTDGVTAGHTNQKPPGYREIVLQTTADTADRILAVRQAWGFAEALQRHRGTETFAHTCMPPMISVRQMVIIIELLRAMAEATEFEIRSTTSGDAPGQVEFYPPHEFIR